MKYAHRLTRDVGTNAVSVHPVVRVRDTVRPFRVKYRYADETHYAESLRLFDTREEAETACREETVAAEFSRKDLDELARILREDIAALKELGFSQNQVSRWLGIPKSLLNSYKGGYNPPNARIVARIHLILPLVREIKERIEKTLPLRESCGVTGLSRPYPRAKKYRTDQT